MSKVWNPTVKLVVFIMTAAFLAFVVMHRFEGGGAKQSDAIQDHRQAQTPSEAQSDPVPSGSESTVAQSRGGNRAMMENNAKSLIEINEAILEDLRIHHRNGEIRLVATVTGQDDERVVRIERLEQSGDASNSKSAVQVTEDQKPETELKRGGATIRFGPIPDYSRGSFAGPQHPVTIKTETLPVTENTQRHRIESLLNAHPNLKLVELDSEGIRRLPDLDFLSPAGGAAILYW